MVSPRGEDNQIDVVPFKLQILRRERNGQNLITLSIFADHFNINFFGGTT